MKKISSYPLRKMKYNNIDYQRCVLICMVVMIHIVNFSTLYPDVKNFINFFFMQAFLLITGYLVNIRKTYKEFASYTMKILIPYIIMVTGYAFVSTLLPVRDGVNEFTIPIILNTIFVTSIGPYWFLYTMAICGGNILFDIQFGWQMEHNGQIVLICHISYVSLTIHSSS